MIPPLLVLAFTHGIGILIKAIGAAFSEYSELVNAGDEARAATPPHVAPTITASDVPAVTVATSAPVIARMSSEPVARGSVTKAEPWSNTAATAPEHAPIAHDIAPVAHDVAAVAHDVAAVARDIAPVAPASTLLSARMQPVADGTATTELAEASPMPEQTTRALLEFIEQVPNLSAEVRETARMKILDPDLTFATIAERTGGVATSTALRRYNKAEAVALKAGFSMPPLPYLSEGSFGHELTDERELVTS